MKRLILAGLFIAFVVAIGVYIYNLSLPSLPKDVEAAYNTLPEELDYNIDVKPILADKCFACHGPDKAKQKAGLRLDMASSAYADLPENEGKVAVSPGDLRSSELFHRIISDDPEYMMPSPKSHLNLTPKEKAILIKWVKQGGEYKPHWAFVKPVKSDVPDNDEKNWKANNPIDNFVLDKLKQKGLHPLKEADKETLLRRLSFDLTGLPPTIAELDAFLKDKSPQAYEKQVNRLLGSAHYGEKMAVDWLDVARFADSHGYTVDRIRDMSPYRDWIIGAFNSNVPYDKFLHWQLSGDLMPKPNRDMIVATAFNRNHPQNMEGGIVEEEFQSEYVVDRTNTFGTAMLGLTMGCAKCHDHKYDPISQKNYYQLFSFFNNVKEAGQISWDDALPTPTLMLPDKQKEKTLNYLKTLVNQQKKKLQHVEVEKGEAFKSWLNNRRFGKSHKNYIPADGLQAHYDFDKGKLINTLNSGQAVMKREAGSPGDKPVFVNHENGKSLQLDGDNWLDLDQTGVFGRSEPFSIAINTVIPSNLKEGVIFHKCVAERLYNFKGYYLRMRANRLEISMVHTAPSNAITKVSRIEVPRNKWINLTLTYDGTSKAAGLKLYLQGNEMPMDITMDQLTKEILYSKRGENQAGLQVGAWWRGSGFKNGKVDDILVYNRTLSPLEVSMLAKKTSWQAMSQKASFTPAEIKSLRQYYFSVVDEQAKAEGARLKSLNERLADSVENVPELMVMQEMPHPKKTFLLQRGNYDMPGEQVFPNTPESVLPFPKNLPKNRYGLALWATSAENPLTARVAVNRMWQNFFGVGLVKTSEDFGNQGEMPSHPELLDWLAVSFMESGWNVKQLTKMMVMSATYRQDSRADKSLRETDPENRWLARGPAYRMSAEMIRDNALMASGLLNLKIGGKSVKPYQPEGLWEINNVTYVRDTGSAVYRRSLYVIIKRSVPNPTLNTFDASERSYCVIRRQSTNTPLQALVTLNDPTFVEASRALGAEMCKVSDTRQAIAATYRKLTGRRPTAKELELLSTMQQLELRKFRQQQKKQTGWINTGQFQADSSTDRALLAANTVVASTILNSDASLTKR